MKIVFLYGSLLFSFFTASVMAKASAVNEYPRAPRCPSFGTNEVWKKNFDRCMEPFLQNNAHKRFKIGDAKAACTCVANGVVNAWTCDEWKRHDQSDAMEQAKWLAPITEKCGKKLERDLQH